MSSNAPRNREATEARIIAAAVKLLAEEGFAALGVNKLAAAAGVDKQLIYRYFEGMDGVVDRIARDLRLWLGEDAPDIRPASYAELIDGMLTHYHRALKENPLLRRILLWELSENTDALRRLESARSGVMSRWFMGMKGELTAPPGVDAPAINALLLAGLHYLVLRQETLQGFAGMKLETEADWDRVMAAARSIIDAVYDNTKPV